MLISVETLKSVLLRSFVFVILWGSALIGGVVSNYDDINVD